MSFFNTVHAAILAPFLVLLALAMAVNVLWLVPLAALGYLCRPRSEDPVRRKRVLVTGGSSGIGLAVAKLCASRGADSIILVARNQSRLDAAKEAVSLAGGHHACKVQVVSIDLANSSQSEVDSVVQDVVGSVDVVVCSAGDSGEPEVFDKITEESCEAMFRLNVLGVMKMTKAVLPAMRSSKHGSICLIGSMAGQAGMYGLSAYSASKFALRGFAESLRMEVKPAGINLCLVQPPDTDTPMLTRENTTKPAITKELSAEAGLWSAEQVASGILDGIAQRRFIIGFGLDGFMLNAVTAGMAPADSPVTEVIQILCLPLFRLVAIWYVNHFDRVVARHSKEPKSHSELLP